MIKLAESSGTVLCEDGNKLYICNRSATWTTVFLFVTGLLTIILLVNGVLQLVVFGKQNNGSTTAGTILLAAGIVFAIIFWRVLAYHQKKRSLPLDKLPVTGIIDFDNKVLLDGNHTALASLSQVYLTRKMQLSSSSPELLLRWQNGAISIVKGNPFSGGIAGIEKALISKGIPKR